MAIISHLFAPILCVAAVPAWCATPLGTSNPRIDDGLRQAFTRSMYSLEHVRDGMYRGQNMAQQLTLEFDRHDVRLSHPDGAINFHLAGYGYGDRLRLPAPVALSASGDRLEYQRGDLTEWYVNGSQGLEQGFTFAHRPGNGNVHGDPLVIALGVSGELAPHQTANAVLFKASHGVVLRYAGLKAWDARGRVLASRLEVRGHELRLTVDDRSAQYPVIVDPTWTEQQELTPSDLAEGDQFGCSVVVSGDTAILGSCRSRSAPTRTRARRTCSCVVGILGPSNRN